MNEKQFPNAVLLPEVVKMLQEGRTVTLLLKGYSMRPFLEDGRDKALLARPVNPNIGDPVLAEITPGRFVLHRIIGMTDEKVTLLGDGNLVTETCRPENICGSVIGFFRKGRKEMDKTDGWKWKTYSWIWMRMRPIRRYLLAFYRRIWLKLFKPI
ncbi:MAG: S24/S26 family peptidase [Prevotella sp.]|nr:S24/S26 family peptidase [Prevotella sp.]